MKMLYIIHDTAESILKNGINVKDTEDGSVEVASLDALKSAYDKDVFIGGLDSIQPLIVRKAKRQPYLYDYCKANSLNFLEELDDDSIDEKSVSIGTKLNVHWKCAKGHKWVARVDSRVRYNQGCPYCNRETGSGTSFSEQRYFYYLSKYIDDLENRVLLDGYEFDIYSKILGVAIEYDGGFHNTDNKLKRDIEKTEYANSIGLTLIRIRGRGSTNYDFDCLQYDETADGYLFIIKDILRRLGFNYLSFKVEDSDDYIIFNAYKQRNKNSVLNIEPDMLKYYAYDLNENLDLGVISKASEIKAYWYCAICGKPYLRSFHQVHKGFNTCSSCKDLKMLLSRIEIYGNAISDSFSELIKWYDVNKYPFYALQSSSNQFINFKCPCCGNKFRERLTNVTNRGYISCSVCGEVRYR